MLSILKNAWFLKALNGVIFYVGWFFCLSSAVQGNLDYVLMLMLVLAIHFIFEKARKKEALLIALVVAIGFISDSLYIVFGVLKFASPNSLVWWGAPFWVLGIYTLLAMTINHSLSWLKPYLLYAAVLGAGGGAFSYAVGEGLGAATFLLPYHQTVLIIGAVWFVEMPLIYAVSRYLDRLEI